MLQLYVSQEKDNSTDEILSNHKPAKMLLTESAKVAYPQIQLVSAHILY